MEVPSEKELVRLSLSIAHRGGSQVQSFGAFPMEEFVQLAKKVWLRQVGARQLRRAGIPACHGANHPQLGWLNRAGDAASKRVRPCAA